MEKIVYKKHVINRYGIEYTAMIKLTEALAISEITATYTETETDTEFVHEIFINNITASRAVELTAHAIIVLNEILETLKNNDITLLDAIRNNNNILL